MADFKSGGHTFLGSGAAHQRRFKQWWAVARQSEDPPSPYDFLVNGFGLHSDRAEHFLMVELRRSSSALRLPGYFDYMAHHCAKGVDNMYLEKNILIQKQFSVGEDILNDRIHSIDSAREINPATEQDLLALADVTRPKDWALMLSTCLCCDFSPHFLRTIFGKAPGREIKHLLLCDVTDDEDEGFNSRKVMDIDRTSAILSALPKVEELSIHFPKWAKTAFQKLVNTLWQSTSLKELWIQPPAECVDDEDSNGTKQNVPLFASPQEKASTACGIKAFTFDLRFDKDEHRPHVEVWSPACPWILESIFHLPNLQELRLLLTKSPSLLKKALPFILEVMKCPKLEDISINAVTRADKTSKSAVVKILNALKHNPHITSFGFDDKSKASGSANEPFQRALYENKLLEILDAHNTTLTSLTLKEDDDEDPSSRPLRSTLQRGRRIDYYISLNAHGRNTAQDPNTSVKDFVGLLSALRAKEFNWDWSVEDAYEETASSVARYIGKRNRTFNLLYGLLRELPGSWSMHAAAKQGPRRSCRKRKCKRWQDS